jgi:recombination protein RecA
MIADHIEANIQRIRRSNRQQGDEALERILKKRGLKPLSEQKLDLEFISSGVPEIDLLVAGGELADDGRPLGGFPVRAITEIFGRKGVGKSSLLAKLTSQQTGKTLYIDTEGAINDLGVIPSNVTILRQNAVEVIWGIVNDALEENSYDLIVIDGVAALTTAKEIADDNDPAGFQDRAKKISSFMRNMEHYLKDSDTAVVFTNQQKESMDPFKPKQTMGGAAVAYASSVRLELLSNSSDKIIKDGVKVGHKIRVKLEKNRFGPDGQETTFKLLFKDLS